MLNRMRVSASVLLAGVIVAGTMSAQTSQLAFTVNAYGGNSNNPFYIGFEFSVSSPKTVNLLGILNTNSNTTLPADTGVGIYSVSPGGTSPKAATAVVTTIVPGGTASTNAGSLGAFVKAVTPTVLAPGNYVLLAETGTAAHEGYGQASMTFIPGITYVNGWFAGQATSFPGLGVNTTVTNQSNGGNKWISAIFGVQLPPSGATLDFSTASSGSVPDSAGQGTGFSVRLPGTGANYTGNDPNLTLNTSSKTLTLSSTAADVNGSGNLGAAEFVGVPLSDYGIGQGSDFMVRATFTNIQLSQNSDQFGVFIGADAKNIVRGGVLHSDGGSLFTALTIPSGSTAIDTGQQFGPSVSVGDTVVMTLSRLSGQWSFYVDNRTNPANSGAVAITTPSIPDYLLFAGVFAANPGNTTPKIEVLKDFYAGAIQSSATYAGADLTTQSAWRTPTVTKALDGDGNNIYGTDGYAITKSGGIQIDPSYAAVARVASSTFPGNSGYLSIDNPGGTGQVLTGVWYSSSTTAGVEQDFASITFSRIVRTRVGILISNTDFSDISPDHLRIRQTSGGTADSGLISTPLNALRTGDWYFFDIAAKPGDVFVISGTNAINGSPASASNGIGAISFDGAPAVTQSATLPQITTTSLPGATQGSSYQAQMAATSGTAPYTWSATGLPAGLNISSGGLIAGVPAGAGTAQIVVKVTDAASGTATKTLALSVAPNVIPLYVTGAGNLGATSIGKPAVSGTFSASGGVPPYSWTLAGAPNGISLTANGPSASVGGTPTQAGVFNFAVTVTDAQNLRASAGGSVSVLGLSGANLPDGTAFVSYSGSIPAVGGVSPYAFQVTGLPAGLSISNDGSVRGIPQRAGTFNLSVNVSDAAGNTASGSATLVINPAAALSLTGNLGAGSMNTPYSGGLNAAGGGAPYIFSIAGGSLPAGIRMSSSGSFSGTPTTAGAFTFTARVTDTAGTSVTGNFTITIAPPPVTISAPSPLPSGMATIDYPGQTLTASGGIGPYIFKVTSGNLPAGMALSDGGALSGTPATAGSYSFSVTATDTTGLTASAGLSMDVRPFSADIILSEGTVAFSFAAGTAALPAGTTVRVQSTDVARSLNWSVTSSVPWLDVVGAKGSTPGSFTVVPNTAAAALTAATSPYTGTVTATCLTAPCAGKTQTVNVNASVQNFPPVLSVSTASLAFTGSTSNPVALSQTFTISNSGGGTLGIGSVVCGASWCTLSGVPATLGAGNRPPLQ